MSNKTQLQSNNETLGSILSNVLGLPSQESLKHGQYVWKKYDQKPYIVTISVASANSGAGLKLTSSDVDLTTIDASYLAGTSGVYGGYNLDYGFESDTIFYYYSSNGTKNTRTYTYDPSTQIVTFNSALSSSIVWRNISKKIGKVISLVVDESELKYPDGGMQDGYWYKKVGTNIEFGEVTLASTQTNITVAHSLGVVPSYAVLMHKDGAKLDSYAFLNLNGQLTYGANSSGAETYALNAYSGSIKCLSKSSSLLTFSIYSNSYPYRKGAYYWFAMA